MSTGPANVIDSYVRPSIAGEAVGHRYMVESHTINHLPLEKGETGKVTKVEITNLRVSWDPDKYTVITTLVPSATLTAVEIPGEDISDFEYTFSTSPQGLDDHARDDVVRSILENLGLGKF